jgi:hypothetical protein
MAHPFELKHEMEVQATTEEVWDGVRTDDGLYRLMHSFDASVGMGHYIFIERLDQRQTEDAWRTLRVFE